MAVQAALADFRSGKVQVLVATDVAARGLHLQGLPYVVNYDFPPQMDAYIHRAGRTGRLAAHGHVISFFSRSMAPLAHPLLQLLQVASRPLLGNAPSWQLNESVPSSRSMRTDALMHALVTRAGLQHLQSEQPPCTMIVLTGLKKAHAVHVNSDHVISERRCSALVACCPAVATDHGVQSLWTSTSSSCLTDAHCYALSGS